MKTTLTTSTAKKIAKKLFNMDAYSSNQSTKVELSYYSNRVERIIILSTCRTATGGLVSAVEWLVNNKDIPSVLITGYRVIKNGFGKTEHFDFVEEITRQDLDNNFTPFKIDGILFQSQSAIDAYVNNKELSSRF